MPFLRFHAIKKDRLDLVGDCLISEIVQTLGCPKETVVLEVINSDFIAGDNGVQAYPFVEVLYFERPLAQQERVAEIIYTCLKAAGYPEADIYFSYLRKQNYYENGKKL